MSNLDNVSSDSESDNNSSSSDSETSHTTSILHPSISVVEVSNNSNVNTLPISPPLSECPANSYLIWNQMPSFSIEQCSYDPEQGLCESESNSYATQLIDNVGGQLPWNVNNTGSQSYPLNTITNNYVNTNNQNNSDSSNDEEQTTDYNNEESITANEPNPPTLQNIGVPNLNLENISNININGNPIISEVNANSSGISSQYPMLYNDDGNNPFYKCNLGELEYDTDEEESKETYRIMYFWNYEFNYDYFSLNDVYIFNYKTDLFKSKLNELKSIRNTNSSKSTGNIIKLESGNNISNLVNLYLIAYYDNAKTNIEFYGIYNQEIDEEKLIENIKLESIYGKKGSVSSNLITNLGENDFIVLHLIINIQQ